MNGQKAIIGKDGLELMLRELASRGYTVHGPTLRDGAILYEEIAGVSDLPEGWTDLQQPGSYRVVPRKDKALFGYAVGPHSWKRFLHPPRATILTSEIGEHGIEFKAPVLENKKFAFFGVRSCELHAISIQDRVFLGGPCSDTIYESRRKDLFLVAVNCTDPAGTCFCVSMETGPSVSGGYDLALTEVIDSGRHYFVVESGTADGESLLASIPHQPAEAAALAAEAERIARAAQSMGRTLDTTGIQELLYRNLEHPRWDDVATRCLACTNCTLACPTCFCTSNEDLVQLGGKQTIRERRWDSCFTLDFSHLHGGSVRPDTRSRYRQWLTHKLATWIDQFGTSGCVGCGRCITWCPVGIDITEEVAAIRSSDAARGGSQ